MSLVSVIVVLIVVGVLLWAVNSQLAAFLDSKILKIINVVVVIFVCIWLLKVAGLLAGVSDIKVGP
jgi:hypothetical protein